MALTLLLDLDDTLLNTNLGEFVPAYFQALAKHLSKWIQPALMLSALMSGTEQMLANEDPALTLQTVFESHFYPTLGIAKAEVQEAIEDFYDNAFHSLSAVTHKQPGAAEVVDWAIGRGFRVAIATDPLMPRKAVYERLHWAGLNPESFEVIASFETFHFTKSHPAYYAEMLGRLGWPDGPVLMVGNDEERDLACAKRLGLMTYRVEAPDEDSSAAVSSSQDPTSAGQGTLSALCQWIEAMPLASLEPDFKTVDAIRAILRSTPAVISGLTDGLDSEQWRHEPAPDDWAMIEIVSHLRDTEREVHHDQLRTLLEDAQPFVPRPDAAVWAKQRKYLDDDGPQATREFVEARKKTLQQLEGLAPDMWKRGARHAIFGPTDFQEVVGFMADHDRLHIQQAWRTLRGLP